MLPIAAGGIVAGPPARGQESPPFSTYLISCRAACSWPDKTVLSAASDSELDADGRHGVAGFVYLLNLN